MRVLVYDSSAQVREGFVGVLIPNGFEVVCVKEKKDIFPMFAKRPFNVAILEVFHEDEEMMNLVRTMKQNELYKNINIIIHILEPTKFFIVELMKLGVAGYLLKPFNEKEVLSRLTLLLEKAGVNIKNIKQIVVNVSKEDSVSASFRSSGNLKIVSTNVVLISCAGFTFTLNEENSNEEIKVRDFINNIQVQIGSSRIVTQALVTMKRDNEYTVQFTKLLPLDQNVICKFVYDKNLRNIMSE